MSTDDANVAFEKLLQYMKRSRGFDFSGYKRPSLMRRIRKRMQMVGMEADDFESYLDYLEVHPQEFTHLFNTILINVTSFFRDAPSWEYLRNEIVPRIMAGKQPGDLIRVWCAGTASGEEAYSIAMLLAESLGRSMFLDQVKIYATDVDDEALAQARLASYDARSIATLEDDLVKKYFEQQNGRYLFRKDMRRVVIFGRHDLVQDAPISRVDLLSCRNTLMYFNAEAQQRILNRFHFALNDAGFLFLGKAEMLFTHTSLFAPVEIRCRVFAKVPQANLRDRLVAALPANSEEGFNQITRHVRFREAAFNSSPVAQVVVDSNGFVALANERARSLFGISTRDLTRPLQEMDFTYRLPTLRPSIERAQMDRRVVTIPDVDWPTISGDSRSLDFQVLPLVDPGGALLGVSISATDVTIQKKLQLEVERASQELETAYEELQSTNEELETTNEELQSTNEELETMNEELQSTNEELQTVNQELHRRTLDASQSTAYLESILSSLRAGVVVVDRDLAVQVWNEQSHDFWGLRADEVRGKNFLNLDIGLPVDRLKQPIRACMNDGAGDQSLVLEAMNRRGKSIQMRVQCTRLHGSGSDQGGVILLMEEQHP